MSSWAKQFNATKRRLQQTVLEKVGVEAASTGQREDVELKKRVDVAKRTLLGANNEARRYALALRNMCEASVATAAAAARLMGTDNSRAYFQVTEAVGGPVLEAVEDMVAGKITHRVGEMLEQLPGLHAKCSARHDARLDVGSYRRRIEGMQRKGQGETAAMRTLQEKLATAKAKLDRIGADAEESIKLYEVAVKEVVEEQLAVLAACQSHFMQHAADVSAAALPFVPTAAPLICELATDLSRAARVEHWKAERRKRAALFRTVGVQQKIEVRRMDIRRLSTRASFRDIHAFARTQSEPAPARPSRVAEFGGSSEAGSELVVHDSSSDEESGPGSARGPSTSTSSTRSAPPPPPPRPRSGDAGAPALPPRPAFDSAGLVAASGSIDTRIINDESRDAAVARSTNDVVLCYVSDDTDDDVPLPPPKEPLDSALSLGSFGGDSFGDHECGSGVGDTGVTQAATAPAPPPRPNNNAGSMAQKVAASIDLQRGAPQLPKRSTGVLPSPQNVQSEWRKCLPSSTAPTSPSGIAALASRRTATSGAADHERVHAEPSRPPAMPERRQSRVQMLAAQLEKRQSPKRRGSGSSMEELAASTPRSEESAYAALPSLPVRTSADASQSVGGVSVGSPQSPGRSSSAPGHVRRMSVAELARSLESGAKSPGSARSGVSPWSSRSASPGSATTGEFDSGKGHDAPSDMADRRLSAGSTSSGRSNVPIMFGEDSSGSGGVGNEGEETRGALHHPTVDRPALPRKSHRKKKSIPLTL